MKIPPDDDRWHWVGAPHYPEENPMKKQSMKKQSKPKRMKRTQSEPALVRGAVVAVLALLASLGVGWATEVDATVVTGVVVAVIALGQAVWTRYSVTANAKVITQVTTDGQVVTGEAASAPTGSTVDLNKPPHPASASNAVYVDSVLVRPELVD